MEKIINELETRVAKARREYARNRAEQQELVRQHRVIFTDSDPAKQEIYDALWRRNHELTQYINMLTNTIAGLRRIDDITFND